MNTLNERIDKIRWLLEDAIWRNGNEGKHGRKGTADHWRIELHGLGGRADEFGGDTADFKRSEFLFEAALARAEYSRRVDAEIHALLGDPKGAVAGRAPHPEVARRPSVAEAAKRSFDIWWKYDRPAFMEMKEGFAEGSALSRMVRESAAWSTLTAER